jgi:ferredoxin
VILTLVGVFLVGANAERWCPFGGIEALYTYLDEGNMTCSLAVSNFYILGAVLVSALLLRRVFCGYACPIGALSEWIQKGASKLGIKPARVPGKVDGVLALLKYPLLAVILYFTWRAGELIFRGFDPCYALLSRHGEDITFWTYAAAGAVVIASVFITVPFCRWLCPLAAVLNPISRIGVSRVRRDPEACTDCGKCAKACPMAIPVDKVLEVTHARCTSCLDCLGKCPETAQGALHWKLPGMPGEGWRPRRAQALLVTLLLLIMTTAVCGAYLFPLPSFVWTRGEAEAPQETADLELRIEGLHCRGNASLFTYFLDRDDELSLEGYLRLEAWPDPNIAAVRILYDSSINDEAMIKMAITEAYFDMLTNDWRHSPFIIEGYDPLGF